MCVVSYVGDYWRYSLPQKPYYDTITTIVNPLPGSQQSPISRAEFEALKHDIEELKTLLLAAKQYDAATGQPDCEHDDKVALIRKVAEIVGVSMEDVFGHQGT